jgi:hypothetical protein
MTLTIKQKVIGACLLVSLGVSLLSQTAGATCSSSMAYPDWLNCKLTEVVQARLNQNSGGKQTDTPSLGSNSSSLVDQSSAGDLIGMALNLGGLTSKSNEMDATSSSITTSAYALFAAANRTNPLDPAFYSANRNWRRLSFTLGQEFPDQNGAVTTGRANVYGVKYLFLDHRDASEPANRKAIDSLVSGLGAAGLSFSRLNTAVVSYLHQLVAPTQDMVDFVNNTLNKDLEAVLARLTPEQMQQIDTLIETSSDAELTIAREASQTIDAIANAPQASVSFQSKVAKDANPNEYRLEFIFDKGVYKLLNFTTNASYEYKDSPLVGMDTRGARFTEQIQIKLNSGGSTTPRRPAHLTIAGEGKWMTKTSPTYKFQGKLSFTLLPGLELPISVTWASQTDLIKESDVKGKIGFTFDVAKLARAFAQF